MKIRYILLDAIFIMCSGRLLSQTESFNWNNNSKTEREILIDTKNYSGGLYQLVLRGPNKIILKNVTVLK